MASPHVAGLLAYFLSIYPSVSFEPLLENSLIPETILGSTIAAAGMRSLYTVVHAALPAWISSALPSPFMAGAQQAFSTSSVAPIPHTLTPAQLKKAILTLSLKDQLTDLPEKTVNKLIFNNATDTFGNKKFMEALLRED